MAKTPQNVRGLLERVWKPARERAMADRDAMQALIAEEGGNFKFAAWDWRYYAEKLRQRRANFDDQAIKPYLTLDGMIAAAFDTAHRLFGVSFTERKDIPVWHPDVRVWQVTGRDGREVGPVLRRLLCPRLEALRRVDDLDARPAEARRRHDAADPQRLQLLQGRRGRAGAAVAGRCPHPVPRVRPRPARPAARTSSIPRSPAPACSPTSSSCPRSSTSTGRSGPRCCRHFARHYKTGEPLPDDLLKRFLAARKFNQGFATVEYVANALIDLEFHSQPASAATDVRAFERKELDKIGMPEEIALRHRPTQFGHIFSGDHYASGYYSYMWSEVMDADAFGAFEEAGNIFDPAVAKRLHDDIYSSGGSRDPEEAYVAFRGRKPEPDALLRRRGLLEVSPAA